MKYHPAIGFGAATPIILLGYRLMPNIELALAWYAWTFVGLAICLQVCRGEIPDEAISIMVLIAFASSAAGAAGDAKLARLLFGLNIVAFLVIVSMIADDLMWWAYAVAGMTEFAAWLLGNISRGTFGPEIAHSAIGQAYGPWAQPAQLVIIAMAYAIAFTWRRAGPT